MARDAAASRFTLIVGVHDLAEQPDAQGDELGSWLPFSRVQPLLERVHANSLATSTPLHVTSDDGFRSDFEVLMPWLLEHGVAATFFIATRLVGRPGRLSVAQLREMRALGMRMGVHGARHIDWSRTTPTDFIADLREGRQTLQDWLGEAVDVVAPPFGGYDGLVVRHLLAEGYREIHTCRSGVALDAEVLKPRNMLKEGAIDAVLAVSRRPGNVADAARARLRRVRAGMQRHVVAA